MGLGNLLLIPGLGGGVAPLDIKASVGTSTSPTSTGTKAVTGVGFEPKVVMPFSIYPTVTGSSIDLSMSYGIGVSSSNRATIAVSSRTSQSTSVTHRRHTNAGVTTDSYNGSTAIASNLNSLDSDGFTLNWGAVPADARILNHICLGGADLEVSLTQHQMNNTNAAQSFAHGLSGAPTGLLFFTTWDTVAPPNTTTQAIPSIGAWSSSFQFSANIYLRNNVITTNTKRGLRNDCVASTNDSAGAFQRTMAVSSVDATNVNCTYPITIVAGQRYFWMLAIRGAKCQTGTFDCNGSTDPLTISTTGITPKLFLPIFIPGGVDNINTVQNGCAISIGASDGTNTVSCGITDANAVTTTNARRFQDSTGLSEYDFDGTLETDSLVSFSGESVIIDPSTNTGTTWGQGAYLVIGS